MLKFTQKVEKATEVKRLPYHPWKWCVFYYILFAKKTTCTWICVPILVKYLF